MKLEEAVEVINSLDTQLKELTERKNALVRQRDELKGVQGQSGTLCGA